MKQALFALGLFSSGGPGQKTAFITTIVAVAGSTYLFSGLLVWAVRKPKRREVFKMPWKYAKKLTESFVDRISQ
jgi:hypothetical protein